MILSQNVAINFCEGKRNILIVDKGKHLMIIPSKLSSSFIPIYKLENTNFLRNALELRPEGKNRHCLRSYSTTGGQPRGAGAPVP